MDRLRQKWTWILVNLEDVSKTLSYYNFLPNDMLLILVDATSGVSSLQSVLSASQASNRLNLLTPSLAKFFRADLITHVTNWPSEILEKQVRTKEACLSTLKSSLSSNIKFNDGEENAESCRFSNNIRTHRISHDKHFLHNFCD